MQGKVRDINQITKYVRAITGRLHNTKSWFFHEALSLHSSKKYVFEWNKMGQYTEVSISNWLFHMFYMILKIYKLAGWNIGRRTYYPVDNQLTDPLVFKPCNLTPLLSLKIKIFINIFGRFEICLFNEMYLTDF